MDVLCQMFILMSRHMFSATLTHRRASIFTRVQPPPHHSQSWAIFKKVTENCIYARVDRLNSNCVLIVEEDSCRRARYVCIVSITHTYIHFSAFFGKSHNGKLTKKCKNQLLAIAWYIGEGKGRCLHVPTFTKICSYHRWGMSFFLRFTGYRYTRAVAPFYQWDFRPPLS